MEAKYQCVVCRTRRLSKGSQRGGLTFYKEYDRQKMLYYIYANSASEDVCCLLRDLIPRSLAVIFWLSHLLSNKTYIYKRFVEKQQWLSEWRPLWAPPANVHLSAQWPDCDNLCQWHQACHPGPWCWSSSPPSSASSFSWSPGSCSGYSAGGGNQTKSLVKGEWSWTFVKNNDSVARFTH